MLVVEAEIFVVVVVWSGGGGISNGDHDDGSCITVAKKKSGKVTKFIHA